jgi:phosphohistidine phosphatase
MALQLARALLLAELGLCSAATRALNTSGSIAELHGSSVEERIEEELCGTGGTARLARLPALSEQNAAVLLIGHNPAVQDLLIELASDGDPARLDSVRAGFPTCALATLRVRSRWSELGPSTASLEGLLLPRTLSNQPR